MTASLLLFGSLVILLFLSVPIAIAIALSTIIAVSFSGISLPFSVLTQGMVTANDSFPLMAVPFFILAGEIMGKGGISKRLFDIANSFVGHYTGGFAIATVLTAMFFAAISGSGPATVAAIGGIMIPAMVNQGYDKTFATALVAASGTIGIIIPPSVPMVIYGVSANTSIGDLFMAGMVPGVLCGLALMIWAYVHSKKRGYQRSAPVPWKERWQSLNQGKWALLLPVIILGGIYGGVVTPTEAAVVSVVYGLVISTLVYKETNFRQILRITADASLTTVTIMLIVASAAIFGRVLALEQIPTQIAQSITSVSDNPIVFLLLVNVLLLIVGMFMETIAAIIILTPIFMPLVSLFEIDPVHFGIILIVNLSIGFITPPLGLNLFVAAAVSSLKIQTISRAIIPALTVLLLVVLLVTFIPQISLFLV